MKNYYFKTSLLTLLVVLFSLNSFSQGRDAWKPVPYFNGENSQIHIEDLDAENNNKCEWVDKNFGVDMWIKCDFSSESASDGEIFTIFGAGQEADWDDCFILYLVKSPLQHNQNRLDYWHIRIDAWAQDDYRMSQFSYAEHQYHFSEFDNIFANKWVHIHFQYKDASENSDRRATIWVNGIKTVDKYFRFYQSNKMDHIVLGGHNDNPDEGFKGYIAGFRLWQDCLLGNNDVAYIKNRTFNGVRSWNGDYNHLDEKLKVNTYYENNSYKSTRGNVSYTPNNISWDNQEQYPGLPPSPGEINENNTAYLDSIRLDFSDGMDIHDHFTYKVQRKRSDQSNYSNLAIVQNTYFTDTDPAIFDGSTYDYKVEGLWWTSHSPNGYMIAPKIRFSNGIKPIIFDAPQNIRVTQDASSGSCNGDIQIEWDEVSYNDTLPKSYTIYYKVEDGNWQELANDIPQNHPEYTHQVPAADHGKQINFRVDVNGDVPQNFSNEVTGTANSECNDAPTTSNAVVDGDNIVLTWEYDIQNPNGGPATAFEIYRQTDNSGSFDLLETSLPINQLSYIDNTALSCVYYSYKIRAYNSCNDPGSTASLSASSNSVYRQMSFNNVFTYSSGGKEHAHFDGSKGYFNDKVLLEWSVNPEKKADIRRFEIYRKSEGQSFSLTATIENNSATSYEDLSTQANEFYEYLIRAVSECNGDVISDSLFCVGFRANFGIVSGKITYSGGNAVENVEVRVSGDDPASKASLSFENNYAFTNAFSDDSIFHKPFSFDAWIKPKLMTSGSKNSILSVSNGLLNIYLKDMQLYAEVMCYKNQCAGFDLLAVNQISGKLAPDTWYHVAVDLNPETGYLNLYLNGDTPGTSNDTQKSDLMNIPWVPQDNNGANYCPDFEDITLYLGINNPASAQTSFKGNIDEIRIWQRSRSAEEITRDHTRILTGSSEGLIAYYHLDENLGTGIYDISKTGDNYNKNDMVANTSEFKAAFPKWSAETPTFDQLHPSGITDKNGNYIVEGIRYTGSGSMFNAIPFLGIHEFDPSDINLYISDVNPVHNNINFTDKSAFDFEATAYYKGTNIPVEGAGVYVDNQQQFDAGGHPLETDDAGRISVSVPIGHHYISIKKDNHTFEDNGQWPPPTENDPYKTFDFQENVYGITFYDTTLVILTGRFVGGDVEGSKKPGLGLSYANIGQGRIVFSNEQNYDINPDPNEENTKFSIFTDPETGEYTLKMLPVVYKIDTVKNDHYEIDQLDLGLLDLREVPESITVTDTVFNVEDSTLVDTIYSFDYHFERNFIHYEEPSIIILGENEGPFIGEEIYYVKDAEDEEADSIDLVVNSPFRYPVFFENNRYKIDIKVQAIYENFDYPDTVITNEVPIEDAEVSITNNIERNEPTYTLKTDNEGKVSTYEFFYAGLPNLNLNEQNQTSFTKTMSITAQAGVYNIAWAGNDAGVYRAYVLGDIEKEGTDFVSYGPEIPHFILRDPPGDKSYTKLEKGSSVSLKKSYSASWGTNNISANEIDLGTNNTWTLPGGKGFVLDYYNSFLIGVSKETSKTDNGAITETYTFNESFSTSSSPDAVGSMADVYIGESTNMYFSETEFLRIYSKMECDTSGLTCLSDDELAYNTGRFTLGIKDGYAVGGDKDNTMFVYTQQHILHNLIPNYRGIIKNLLTSSPNYVNNIHPDSLFFGMDNDSLIFKDHDFEAEPYPSYEFLGTGEGTDFDSVAFLNQQISLWLEAIALNEAAKVKSEGSYDNYENISFDGLAGAYTNSVTHTKSSFEQNSYSCKFSLAGGRKLGHKLEGLGTILETKTSQNFSANLGEAATETKEMTWTYVIDDGNQNDYYSIDVINDNLAVTTANSDEFVELDNYNQAFNWIGGVDMVASSIIQLASVWAPGFGLVATPIEIAASAAAYMGRIGYRRTQIDEETLALGLYGASPIFKIKGGQSRCPHEGNEYTFFHVNPNNGQYFKIHEGTQQHEAPKIEIEPANVVNVPAGGTAYFDVRLMNESPTGADLTYELYLSESSNPNGAEVRMDGLSVNGRSFFIGAGQTVNKTLTIKQSDPSILDYENLKLYFCSACQCDFEDYLPDIYDTCNFSVNFIPTCTEVVFANVTANWAINSYHNDVMDISVSGYDINHSTFEKVYFQYEQPGTSPTTAMTLYNDTVNTDWATFTGDKIYIDGRGQVNFPWDVSSLNDGEYTLILNTRCSDGSTFESDHVPGIIDRILPRPFGTPEPSDGILSFGEDILVRFNEKINDGELYNFGQYGQKSYIKVNGVTNGTDLINSPTLLHDGSVHFDGIGNKMILSNLNLDNTDFTFEFWAKRQALGEQCIITFNGLRIGFNAANHFFIEVDGVVVATSNNAYTTSDQWNFYAIAYTRGSEEAGTEPGFRLTILSDATTDESTHETEIFTSLQGNAHVGLCETTAFNGNIHELRIWNYSRTTGESAAQKGQVLSGYEPGLYSLWPMTDCYGTVARDIAFGRNATLNATWHVSRNGKAVALDGTNYFAAPAGAMAFSKHGDFTIEFWFKTPTPATNATLLSNGNPENEFEPDSWTVTATPDNEIIISNNGTDVVLSASAYLDNNWHHFALSMNRIGYLSIYLNGELVRTVSVAPFAGFGGGQLVAGVR